MNDKQLRSFIIIAEKGSFSKAESFSFLSRQALAKQMDSLEAELGYSLLARSSDGVSLTPAGQDFYCRTKAILSEMREMVSAGRQIAAGGGIVRILNPPHPRPLLERVYLRFSQLYPDIQVDMTYHNGDIEAALSAVLNGGVDILECLDRPGIHRTGLEYLPLAELKYHCVMTVSDELASKAAIAPQELSGRSVCMNSETAGDLREILEPYCPWQSIKQIHPSNMLTEIYNACLHNKIYISRAYYPDEIAPLIAVPLDVTLARQYCIVYRTGSPQSVVKFIELARDIWQNS